jgi:hypothetical protein
LNLPELHEPQRADDQRGREQHDEHSFDHICPSPGRPVAGRSSVVY